MLTSVPLRHRVPNPLEWGYIDVASGKVSKPLIWKDVLINNILPDGNSAKFFSRKNMHIEQLVQKIGYYQYILILPE